MNDVKKFITAFIGTIIIVGIIFGFYYVTGSFNKYGYTDEASLVEIKKSGEMTYSVSLLGGIANIDLSALNKIEKYRKKYFSLTPAPLRFISQITTYYSQMKKIEQEQNRISDFEKYVADDLK